MPLLDSLRIREATPDDTEAILHLTKDQLPLSIEERRPRVRGELTALPTLGDCLLVLVAEAAGQVIGFAKARRFEPPPNAPADTAPGGWYLSGLAVTPRARRRGVGTLLTRERLGWIAARTSEAYTMLERDNLASLDLHRRVGFAEVPGSFSFPGDETRTQALFRIGLDAASASPAASEQPFRSTSD